jgi:uncharacterized iron-regulated protein
VPTNKLISRRSTLVGLVSVLATPAISQVRSPFEGLPNTADPNDLIDKIWDPKKADFISVRELIEQLVDAPIILIGERHGFAPHQDRAAFILQALADRGRYPALALEMLEPAQEPVIEKYRRRNPEYARGLGIELDWANTGWPDWRYYEPIFDAAFAAKLNIAGADMPAKEQRLIEQNGLTTRPENLSILESWKTSMISAHCGLIDEKRASILALKQWKRDLAMAKAISKPEYVDGSVLLCGREHTRSDRSVPLYIRSNHTTVNLVGDGDFDKDQMAWITPKPNEEKSILCR